MWVRASRSIGGLAHAVHAAGATAIARLRHPPLATVFVFLLALAWISISGWTMFARQQQAEIKAEELYQREVAKCRELATSEARYECVSRALISRDRQNFGKTLLVFIPPLLLIFGYYVRREIRAAMRDREHARRAEARSRQSMSKLRQEMTAERASPSAKPRLDDDARRHRMYNPSASHASVASVTERTPRRA